MATLESHIDTIVSFLLDIGIPVRFAPLDGETFLPGIRVAEGGLVVDRDKLLYPGDLLHEGGHLALMPPDVRATASDVVGESDPDIDVTEVAAIAWSYAAAIHLNLPVSVVFHESGYRGQSAALLQAFSMGVYLGVADLVRHHLTHTNGPDGFPSMLKWLRA